VIIYDAHNPERGRDCGTPHTPQAIGNITAVTAASRLHVGSGDPPTIGLAHPADPSDPELRNWNKAKHLVTFPRGAVSGPSRIWYNAELKNYNLIQYNGANQPNSVYSTTDKKFQTWTGGSSFTPSDVQGGCGRTFAKVPDTKPPLYIIQTNATADPSASNAGGFFAIGTVNLTLNRFEPTIAVAMPLDFGNLFCNELGSDDPGKGR
jgi:hypothetical protein